MSHWSSGVLIHIRYSLLYFVKVLSYYIIFRLLDTIHQGLIVEGVYSMLVHHFGDFDFVATLPLEFIWQLLFTTLIEITARLFFVYRTWIFNDRKSILPLILSPGLVALANTGLGLSMVVTGLLHNSQSDVNTQLVKVQVSRIGVRETPLIAMLVSLAYILRREWNLGSVGCSIHIYNSMPAMETLNPRPAMVNSHHPPPDVPVMDSCRQPHSDHYRMYPSSEFPLIFITHACMLQFALLPAVYIAAAVHLLLSPLYCNSVLASLKARDFVAKDGDVEEDMVFDVSISAKSCIDKWLYDTNGSE
ncbi:hypothetical protein PLICRDRAFT_173599 [Plicaturopsis crispa FD-325 SS-3]|nr:hypothetical protein PLICRDRAFT_173599 [Plicaturopsis crispa FD-325 SS-3]